MRMANQTAILRRTNVQSWLLITTLGSMVNILLIVFSKLPTSFSQIASLKWASLPGPATSRLVSPQAQGSALRFNPNRPTTNKQTHNFSPKPHPPKQITFRQVTITQFQQTNKQTKKELILKAPTPRTNSHLVKQLA